MSLLEKLKAGKKNVKVIDFPGMEPAETIGISVLTEAETQAAAMETERLFKKAGLDFTAGISDAYQAEQNTQLLFHALVEPALSGDGSHRPYFKTVDEFRSLITRTIKDALTDEYNAWEQECGPNPLTLSDQELEAVFEDVKKNPQHGSGLSISTLRKLVTYLASRPAASPEASGSTSS